MTKYETTDPGDIIVVIGEDDEGLFELKYTNATSIEMLDRVRDILWEKAMEWGGRTYESEPKCFFGELPRLQPEELKSLFGDPEERESENT